MKTNPKTSISISVSGNFIYPDSYGSLSVFEPFYCSKTSANILSTLNFYSLKYPHVK